MLWITRSHSHYVIRSRRHSITSTSWRWIFTNYSCSNPIYRHPALPTNHSMFSEKLILAINAGSSSVKLSLYSSAPLPGSGDAPAPKLILESSISNLTSLPAVFKYTHVSSSSSSSNVDSEQLPEIKSQEDAFKHFLDCLFSDSELKQVRSGEDIAFACHRIVHGGDYDKPIVLGEESLERLKELTDLAPL